VVNLVAVARAKVEVLSGVVLRAVVLAQVARVAVRVAKVKTAIKVRKSIMDSQLL
jgi:hypothetical protein